MNTQKILYIARTSLNEKFGGSVVANRNFRSLEKIFGKENVIEMRLPKTTLKNVFSSLLCLGSYGVPKEVENYICQVQKNEGIGFAFLEGTLASSLVERLKRQGCRVIVFAHNVESHLYTDRWLQEKTLLAKIRQKYVEYCEKKVIECADNLIVLNQRDEEGHFERYGRHADIILPITFEDKSDYIVENINEPYLLFVGSDFFPNNQGLRWFIENVASHIDKFKVLVIGGCCNNPEIRKLKLPVNVELRGYVDDIGKYYREALAVIAPIFFGSGMKTKTVEALSYGKTIFGTPEAFVGIEGDKEKIGGYCTDAEDFINAINNYSGERINDYSRLIFSQYYSDEVFDKKLKQFLEIIV